MAVRYRLDWEKTMLKLTTATAAVIVAAGAAHAVTIDFESFAHGDLVTSVTAGGITADVTVDSNGAFDQARIFDTDETNTADPDLEAPFSGSGQEFPGNILIISENGSASNPDDERLGGTITFNFSAPVDFTGFSAYDGGLFEVTSAKGDTLAVAGNVVAGDNLSNRIDITDGNFLGVSTLNFIYMDAGEGASGGIDDLTFTPSVAPIPVPAALPLLAAGLGGLVLVGRRRKA